MALLTSPSDRWRDAWATCERRPRSDVDAHAAIFDQLAGRAVFALAPGGQGTAVGVRDDAHAGLFAVAVRPEARRAGVGQALVRAIADWAGDRTLYAQVERGNAAGQDFWRAQSFTRAYGYRTWAAPER